NRVLQHIQEEGSSTFLIIIDNLRMDQWQLLKPLIEEQFYVEKEETYLSILPTTTQYARNALLSGLMPGEIENLHPQFWSNDEDEGGKNLHEKDLVGLQLRRLGKSVRYSYNKVLNQSYGKKVVDEIP